ncbi:hypothetical protein [Peredibacter starrii]|uniref:Uncharacterized protein n=1 Tax=Peredibacter starrii TaxID=28202 RepID=A0AAX4HRK7_9BACT|nr:hypothetical protein [Peredibacter starrii]WPU65882.1 hypothetical protein SOO65_03900 [Peredibacter starrii]
MWWMLLLLTPMAFAQTKSDLKAIQELDEELPTFNDYQPSQDEVNFERQNRKYQPPKKIVHYNTIVNSGTQMGAVSAGVPVRNIENNKNYTLSRNSYIRYFNLEDENGFKYIQNKNGTVTWRILSRYVEPIKEELAMYEPPLKYTPAPDNIVRAEYDTKLSIPPEFSFYAGVAKGDYMAKLFNDSSVSSGNTTQYGVHFFTQWKLPLKVGAVLHFEQTAYDGGKIKYTAPSFGPQFKTKEFEILGQPLRFQTQFRVSPLARAQAERPNGSFTQKFNSADLLSSFERPIKNGWGEFVIGVFYQAQWLNMKDQSNTSTLQASNETNKSFGLSFAQVFQ